MAGTRTVHRGSRGRFAGASGGKAERVRVGKRSSLGSRAKNSVIGAKGSAKRQRVKSGAVTLGVAGGLTVGAHFALKNATKTRRGPAPRSTTPFVSSPRRPLPDFGSLSVRSRPIGSPGNPRPMGAARMGGIPMGNGRNLRTGEPGQGPLSSAARTAARAAAATASSARPPSPNYGAAAGRKEFVGRRVTDGNYGFKLKAK